MNPAGAGCHHHAPPDDSRKNQLMNYQDLSAHVGALVSLLGLFAGVSGMLVWRMLVRLEKKVDELAQHFCNCREELSERFVPRFEHEVEHHGMWEALNYHGHDMRGRVVR
jgi:hypothetical protein